jgi:hypothetical protein
MSAQIIPFPKKPAPVDRSPGLPCSSFSILVPIDCLRPASELGDDDVVDIDADGFPWPRWPLE